MSPLVTIVIPVYNGSNYLKAAIDSALAQDYSNIEIIVVNDGSSDNGATAVIARSYKDQIRYFEKPNGGVASALNLAIANMRGEYFSWLSHDDLYYFDKISSQIELLSEFGNDAILYSDFDLIDQDSMLIASSILPEIPPERFRYWLTMESRLHGCSLLIPRRCFEEYGVFDESLLTTQDYDLWFKFASSFKFIRVPRILLASRQHNEQTTKVENKRVVEESNRLSYKYFQALKREGIPNGVNALYQIADSFYKRGLFLASFWAYQDIEKVENQRRWISFIGKVRSVVRMISRHRFLLPHLAKKVQKS